MPKSNLKLSEAIRLGATLKPQAFNGLIGLDGNSTCAIGAALDAAGQLQAILDLGAIAEIFPLLGKRHIVSSIFEWNDGARLSREAIADRVEKIERILDANAATQATSTEVTTTTTTTTTEKEKNANASTVTK